MCWTGFSHADLWDSQHWIPPAANFGIDLWSLEFPTAGPSDPTADPSGCKVWDRSLVFGVPNRRSIRPNQRLIRLPFPFPARVTQLTPFETSWRIGESSSTFPFIVHVRLPTGFSLGSLVWLHLAQLSQLTNFYKCQSHVQ